MKSGLSEENSEIPHDPKVETAVLGSIIFDNKNFVAISQNIMASDFYSSVHEKIYKTIEETLREGTVLDEVVLASKLKSLDLLDDIGGVDYIKNVKKSACHTHLVDSYSKIIKNLSLKRSVFDITSKYSSISSDRFCERDPRSVISELVGEISAVAVERNSDAGFDTTESIVDELFNGESGRVIYTGMDCIDKDFPVVTKGVTIVAGRTSQGKSTLAVQMAKGMAENEYRVDMYSLEMTKAQLAARFIASDMRSSGANVAYRQLYRKDLRQELSDEDVLTAKETARNLPKVNWNDASSMTVSDIICNSMYNKDIKESPDVIIVDYLDEVSLSDMNGENLRGDEKLGKVISRLREFAKNNDCAVIVVVQLNREVEKSGNEGRPFKSALKNSGDIEQKADCILLVYRKCQWLQDKYGSRLEGFPDQESFEEYTNNLDKMEIICAKQRMGPTGSRIVTCEMAYNYITCDTF